MVCAKCQKKLKATELATPGVKHKNDMYYGSPSTTLGGGSADKTKGKSTLGNTGVSKVCSFLRHYQPRFYLLSSLPFLFFLPLLGISELSANAPRRTNSSVPRPRTLMRPTLHRASLARPRQSRDESFASGARTKNMVCLRQNDHSSSLDRV